MISGRHNIQLFGSVLILAVLLLFSAATTPAQRRKAKPVKPPTELAKLQEEFIKVTKEYKGHLERLLAIYERNVGTAEGRLVQSQELYKQGLISKKQLTESETLVATAKERVSEAQRQMANADTQIANTLVEVQAELQLSKTPLRKGTLLNTTSYIRYTGAGVWSLSDAWKVQRFFIDAFKKQLHIGVFLQCAFH
ncbi:MAG: hypothetical protein ACREBG_14985 [Pyrinomonadaceae bacterium]